MQVLKGISFPFRVGGRGGVVMTKADPFDTTHLGESIYQIVATGLEERIMEVIGSQVSSSIFEPDEEGTQTLLKYEISEAISNYDPRVSVEMDDIDVHQEDEKLYAVINFTVIDTGAEGAMTVQLGG